ncbi:MAG: hypothetical protein AB7G25_16565 [Sphingomonadaceae bacterium]
MTPQEQDRLARSRFIILTIMRASGVVMMLLGMGIIGTRIVQPSDLIGGIVFFVGFLDSLILPRILIRKWRTPPDQ